MDVGGGCVVVVRIPAGVGPGDAFRASAEAGAEAEAEAASARPLPSATPVDLPPVTVATPVRPDTSRDEFYAMELVRRELGLYLGRNEVDAAALARDLEAEEVAFQLSDEEQLVVNYRHSIKCFALVHGFLTILNALAGLWGLVGLALLVGPVSGYFGAHLLDARLVGVYALFCVVSVIYELLLFVFYLTFWIFMFFVVKMWIAQIVFKFWRVLALIPKDRARALARPASIHNRRATMVYY